MTVPLVAGALTEVVFTTVVPVRAVIVYVLMGLPPSEGTVQLTVACVFPALALTFVGAAGGLPGTTSFEAKEAGLSPPSFVATTVNV